MKYEYESTEAEIATLRTARNQLLAQADQNLQQLKTSQSQLKASQSLVEKLQKEQLQRQAGRATAFAKIAVAVSKDGDFNATSRSSNKDTATSSSSSSSSHNEEAASESRNTNSKPKRKHRAGKKQLARQLRRTEEKAHREAEDKARREAAGASVIRSKPLQLPFVRTWFSQGILAYLSVWRYNDTAVVAVHDGVLRVLHQVDVAMINIGGADEVIFLASASTISKIIALLRTLNRSRRPSGSTPTLPITFTTAPMAITQDTHSSNDSALGGSLRAPLSHNMSETERGITKRNEIPTAPDLGSASVRGTALEPEHPDTPASKSSYTEDAIEQIIKCATKPLSEMLTSNSTGDVSTWVGDEPSNKPTKPLDSVWGPSASSPGPPKTDDSAPFIPIKPEAASTKCDDNPINQPAELLASKISGSSASTRPPVANGSASAIPTESERPAGTQSPTPLGPPKPQPVPALASSRWAKVCIYDTKCTKKHCELEHPIRDKNSQTLCRFFPNCRYGAACQFKHPST